MCMHGMEREDILSSGNMVQHGQSTSYRPLHDQKHGNIHSENTNRVRERIHVQT